MICFSRTHPGNSDLKTTFYNVIMGIVYLIQPAELVGTNRAKVGCSTKSDLSRVLQYKKGTKYIGIFSTEDPFALEKAIITIFNSHFTKIAGNEYFEGDIDEMRKIFVQQLHSSFSPNCGQLNVETNDETFDESDEDETIPYIDTYEGFLRTQHPSSINDIVITNKKTEEGFVHFKPGSGNIKWIKEDCVKISSKYDTSYFSETLRGFLHHYLRYCDYDEDVLVSDILKKCYRRIKPNLFD